MAALVMVTLTGPFLDRASDLGEPDQKVITQVRSVGHGTLLIQYVPRVSAVEMEVHAAPKIY